MNYTFHFLRDTVEKQSSNTSTLSPDFSVHHHSEGMTNRLSLERLLLTILALVLSSGPASAVIFLVLVVVASRYCTPTPPSLDHHPTVLTCGIVLAAF